MIKIKNNYLKLIVVQKKKRLISYIHSSMYYQIADADSLVPVLADAGPIFHPMRIILRDVTCNLKNMHWKW